MHVILFRTDCDDKPICPSLWKTDRDTTVVQGWVTASDRSVVEVPEALLAGLELPSEPTGRGTLLVRGVEVTDLEALRLMDIPEGEAAVEVLNVKGGWLCSTSTN